MQMEPDGVAHTFLQGYSSKEFEDKKQNTMEKYRRISESEEPPF